MLDTMLSHLKSILVIALLIVVIKAVMVLPQALDARIALEADNTRALLAHLEYNALGFVDKKIDGVRTDLSRDVVNATISLDSRLASIQTQTLKVASDATTGLQTSVAGTLGQVGPIMSNLQVTTANLAAVSAQAKDASDVFLDCEGNPDCLENRVISTLHSVERASAAAERTSETVAIATPIITKNSEELLATANTVGKELVQKQPLGYRITVGVIRFGAGAVPLARGVLGWLGL